MSIQKVLSAILLLGICCSCSQKKETNAPTNAATNETAATQETRRSVDVVKVAAMPADISRNESADAIVRVTVQNGYHINANPPTFSYLKATELTVAQEPGISVSFLVYPDAITKKFPFAEKPLAVYEGTTEIKVRLRADKSSTAGTQNLSGTLRVQACDDQVCYAPGTLDVSIPLNIK